jgi:hypothetical protein
MQHELVPLEPKRWQAAADRTIRTRGIVLESAHDNVGEVAALVWTATQLPLEIAAEIEFILAHAANHLLVCIRNWQCAATVGRAVALLVAERFSWAHIEVEGGDERKRITVESDGNTAWVVN